MNLYESSGANTRRSTSLPQWGDVRAGHRALLLLAATLCLATGAGAQSAPADQRSLHVPLAGRSLLLDAASVEGLLVVVGERGHILTSSDDGATWQQAEVPTRAMLTGVHFHDENLGWAVGHDAVILRTKDGGRNWTLLEWQPEDETPFLDVLFLDDTRGFAIGAYGRFHVTDDGGDTWTEAPIGDDDFHLNHISRAGNGTLYIAAEAGNAYRSRDDGETWELLETPYTGSFFGALPLEDDTVLLFGLRGHLYRSEDAGESWEAIDTGTVAMLNSAARLPGGRILIVGLGGTVLSSDDGHSFRLVPQPTRAGVQAVVMGKDRLLLAGESGVQQLSSETAEGK